MNAKKLLYAQSGGVTPVINATACGVIESARQFGDHISHIYAAQNGILGALREELLDINAEDPKTIAALRHTPGGAFGSCRYKLKSLEQNKAQYERLIAVFRAHDIGYFFYNGGGDSQDTTLKINQISQQMGYPLTCIGIPKTIDNDLPITDNCPGFGSVAKYIATSIREAGFDVASMASSSTKVFIMEVMGRHTGWIAAASGLAANSESESPHIILMPEIAFNQQAFLRRVDECVKNIGYCTVVVSEGIQDASGHFLADSGSSDAFGHKQLGGVAPVIAHLIKEHLGYKNHWSVVDYLQRAARHLGSKTDVEQAYALGKKAVEFAIEGHNAIMPVIKRVSDTPYQWTIDHAPLADVANVEKPLPASFISVDGFSITQSARTYLSPLIQGEDYPPYRNGLPDYVRLQKIAVPKQLAVDFDVA